MEGSNHANVMITSAGRRCYLVEDFKRALGACGRVIAADMSASAPALQCADESIILPAASDDGYKQTLINACDRFKVKLLISINDLELPVIASMADDLKARGTIAAVSSPGIVDMCADKVKMNIFLQSIGLPTPATYTSLCAAIKAIRQGRLKFPLILKPARGSGSICVETVNDEQELACAYNFLSYKLTKTILNANGGGIIIQEKIQGDEYGLDIINDLKGNYRATAIRKKEAMRTGETDKAAIIEDVRLSSLGEKIGRHLRHIGCLDCDLIDAGGSRGLVVIDLNPRFGGGYQFSSAAGAKVAQAYVKWVNGDDILSSQLLPTPGANFSKTDSFPSSPNRGIRVLTAGVFDILHQGHIDLLRRARDLGDELIVGVQDDIGAASSKGAFPINQLENRMEVVKALRYVESTFAYSNIDDFVKEHNFDILVTGPDQTHPGFKRAIKYCKDRGIIHAVLPRHSGISSSIIKQKIANLK